MYRFWHLLRYWNQSYEGFKEQLQKQDKEMSQTTFRRTICLRIPLVISKNVETTDIWFKKKCKILQRLEK